VSALMTIGDFSRAVRMTAKALRFYHHNDILIPAVVDPSNGYRLYSPNQIADAQIVRTLRDLLTPTKARVEIVYRSIPETRAVAITEVIDLPDLASWFRQSTSKLQRIAAQVDRESTSDYGGVWPDELISGGRGLATVFFTVDDAFAERVIGEGAALVELPAVELAVAVHDGPAETAPNVYAALGEHVARHELGTGGPVRERYIQGFRTVDPHTVTEVGWPILRVVH
jgi:DNA-binding transcriptional MerR regulator